jgi:hypothetical protein
VRKDFEIQGNEKIKNQIDLSTIKLFAADSGINITHYFINYTNLCYAVVLKYNNESVYFPVNASYYSLEKNVEMIFEPYNGSYNVKFDIIKKIITLFSKWNATQSKKAGLDGVALYPSINVEQWIKIQRTKGGVDVVDDVVDDVVGAKEPSKNGIIIGFVSNNTNYFIEPISEKEAIATYPAPIQTLLYHPFEINAMLYSVKNGKMQLSENTELTQKLEKSMYEYYGKNNNSNN